MKISIKYILYILTAFSMMALAVGWGSASNAQAFTTTSATSTGTSAGAKPSKAYDVDKIISDLRAQIAQDPQNAYLHEQLGLVLAGKDLKAGLAEINTAIGLAPGDSSIRAALAQVYETAGKTTEAMDNYAQAAVLADSMKVFTPHNRYAGVFDWAAETQKSRSYLYNEKIAKYFESMGRYHEAELKYERALTILSAYPPTILDANGVRQPAPFADAATTSIYTELAELQSRLGPTRPPVAWTRNQIRLNLVLPANGHKHDATIKEMLGRVKTGATAGCGPHADLGLWYLESGQVEQAVVEYSASNEFDADSNSWYQMGYALLLQGRLDDAAIAYQMCQSLDRQGAFVPFAKAVQAAAQRWNAIQASGQ
jgi:tetratricopeptide (TPR) repeat protein